jgi:hypothetical protein
MEVTMVVDDEGNDTFVERAHKVCRFLHVNPTFSIYGEGEGDSD